MNQGNIILQMGDWRQEQMELALARFEAQRSADHALLPLTADFCCCNACWATVVAASSPIAKPAAVREARKDRVR